MPKQIKFRRGFASEWTSVNPILADGEIGVEKDSKKYKIGDGVTVWNALAYAGIGQQGIQGTAGDKGDKGDTGSQGIQGVKGDTGNVGSQGIQGLKGDTGEQGIQGIQGIQGPQGEVGPQGPAGVGLGYTINVQALTSSPADAATIYFGMMPKAPVTTANISKVYIRKAGTIKIAEIYCYSGTAGTAEAWSLYIRKNNTTDYLIATLSLATNERKFTNSDLSIAVAAGDYIEIKSINPTWATNPLTCVFGGYIYAE